MPITLVDRVRKLAKEHPDLTIAPNEATSKAKVQEDEVDEKSALETYLAEAIENPNNDVISRMTFRSIQETKTDILGQIPMTASLRRRLQKSLRDYRYVEDLSEIREGCYTRWVPLKTLETEPRLRNGGILCEIKMTNDAVVLVCKNGMGRFFQFEMEAALVFQKITMQENVVLCAIDAVGEDAFSAR